MFIIMPSNKPIFNHSNDKYSDASVYGLGKIYISEIYIHSDVPIGIMGAQLKRPLNPSVSHGCDVRRVLRRP